MNERWPVQDAAHTERGVVNKGNDAASAVNVGSRSPVLVRVGKLPSDGSNLGMAQSLAHRRFRACGSDPQIVQEASQVLSLPPPPKSVAEGTELEQNQVGLKAVEMLFEKGVSLWVVMNGSEADQTGARLGRKERILL